MSSLHAIIQPHVLTAIMESQRRHGKKNNLFLYAFEKVQKANTVKPA